MTEATCKGPGCSNPPRPHKDKTRRAPIYCSGRCKTAAWRERQRREHSHGDPNPYDPDCALCQRREKETTG